LESYIPDIPSNTLTNGKWRCCIPVSQVIYTSHTENHSCTSLESLLPVSVICKPRKELNKIEGSIVLKRSGEKINLSFSSRFSCFKWARTCISDSGRAWSLLSTSPTCQLNSLDMISVTPTQHAEAQNTKKGWQT